MSSLRRRAIWVQRAMSTERSSIGGRASARTTAPASDGSASSRSQASTSRISARWKNAASPTSRWATARSSSATATAWPSRATAETRIAIRPGCTPSRAISRSTSAATDWACARSLAQRQNSTSPPDGDSAGCGLAATTLAARATRSGQRRPRSSETMCVSPTGEVTQAGGAGTAEAPQRRPRVAGRGQAAARHRPGEAGGSEVELLRVVDQHVLEAARVPGRSWTIRSASRTRSPASRAPASPSIRSWAR